MRNRKLILATLIVGCLLWASSFQIASAQDTTQEPADPAMLTTVADQLATDFPLMTQTAAAQEPTATPEPPADTSVNVTIEQPPVADPVEDTLSRYGVFGIAAIALVVVYFLSRTGIVNAAAGIPKWAFDMGIFGVDQGMTALERAALLTADPLDDKTVADLRKEIAEFKRLVEETRVLVAQVTTLKKPE